MIAFWNYGFRDALVHRRASLLASLVRMRARSINWEFAAYVAGFEAGWHSLTLKGGYRG